MLDVPGQGGGDGGRTLTFAVKDAGNTEFTASCEDSKGVSLTDVADLLGISDLSADEVLAKLGTVTELAVGYATARRSVVFTAREQNGSSLVVVSDKPDDAARAWAGRVVLKLRAGLSDVPLLHGQLPAGLDVGLRGLGLLAAVAAAARRPGRAVQHGAGGRRPGGAAAACRRRRQGRGLHGGVAAAGSVHADVACHRWRWRWRRGGRQ
ncbi:hypothetical protein [Frankia sp. EAN1pec]|uniref:hypothetical protein n=1 Tax=Parafrankia sp. (strain EAN1pec) TaxID=298653 RepID=UPI0002F1CC30